MTSLQPSTSAEVRRWELYVNRHGSVVYTWAPDAEVVEVMPVSEHEDVMREGLRWRQRAEDLEEAICEYLLWEPGRKGHAAAVRALRAVLEAS